MQEVMLDGLFGAATAAAERDDAALAASNSAWPVVRQILTLLAQAQRLLLEPELARCLQLQQQRKRQCAVRFACYDLSSLDHPSSRSVGSEQLQLFEVLLQLRSAQLRLLQQPTAARAHAVRAFCAALCRKACRPADDPSVASARAASAAQFYARGFELLLSSGELLMCERLAEELTSLTRFHMHCVFDRWGGVPRHIDVKASAWNELRFFSPKARGRRPAPLAAVPCTPSATPRPAQSPPSPPRPPVPASAPFSVQEKASAIARPVSADAAIHLPPPRRVSLLNADGQAGQLYKRLAFSFQPVCPPAPLAPLALDTPRSSWATDATLACARAGHAAARRDAAPAPLRGRTSAPAAFHLLVAHRPAAHGRPGVRCGGHPSRPIRCGRARPPEWREGGRSAKVGARWHCGTRAWSRA